MLTWAPLYFSLAGASTLLLNVLIHHRDAPDSQRRTRRSPTATPTTARLCLHEKGRQEPRRENDSKRKHGREREPTVVVRGDSPGEVHEVREEDTEGDTELGGGPAHLVSRGGGGGGEGVGAYPGNVVEKVRAYN